MDALVADVLTFIGSLLKLIGDLIDQGKPMLSGGRSQQQQQQQQISYKDTSSDTTSDTSTKLQPCSTNANCTGFKNGTATTKFTDCGICSSCASEDAQEENDRQCLAACLYYRKGNVTPSDTGCKKLPDNVTTCIDDCTCIENLYFPYIFSNDNTTSPTRDEVHSGVTAQDWKPCDP
ncbi:hypothetical protein HDE_03344 [Halotydeus destructor]|nr:hypothetical protein HDE_03344 [Halotydeus destructor]